MPNFLADIWTKRIIFAFIFAIVSIAFTVFWFQPPPKTTSVHQTQDAPATNPNPSCPVKGNINQKGEKIYHTKFSRFYDKTIPEECFNTVNEAKQAGYRAPRNT